MFIILLIKNLVFTLLKVHTYNKGTVVTETPRVGGTV